MSDGPPRPSFSLRLISGKLPMKLESAVATVVIGAVFGVAWLVFNLPGPLVVHLNDDQKQPVQDARVRCTNEAGDKTFSGVTDVFGEAKWPGLARGMWSCEVWPPARFFSPSMKGAAVVVPRAPASVLLTVERSAQVAITIKRPQHAPYAAMAVRAVCPAERGLAVESWEERTSVLQPKVTLWLPKGRTCRAGLVKPELPTELVGPVTQTQLECGKLPCTGELTGGVGAVLSATLEPTLEQWTLARPPLVPDDAPPPPK